MNDEEGAVRVVLDARLATNDRVNVHPMRNTATLGISGRDLIAFLAITGHQVAVVEVPAPQ